MIEWKIGDLASNGFVGGVPFFTILPGRKGYELGSFLFLSGVFGDVSRESADQSFLMGVAEGVWRRWLTAAGLEPTTAELAEVNRRLEDAAIDADI